MRERIKTINRENKKSGCSLLFSRNSKTEESLRAGEKEIQTPPHEMPVEKLPFSFHDNRFSNRKFIFSGLVFIGIYLSLCFTNGQINENVMRMFHFSYPQEKPSLLQSETTNSFEKVSALSNKEELIKEPDNGTNKKNAINRSADFQKKRSSEISDSWEKENSPYRKYFTNHPPLKYSSGAAGKGILPAVPTAESSGLSSLNWLRGAWQLDLGDTFLQISVSPSDAGGNYLIGRKESRLTDGSLLWIAILVIVRNPINELYETWEFRSDGSFGGGIMEQFGPQWSAPMKYILADGRTMTAVVTFTPQTGGGFIWQENSRTLSDLPLPSLGPINARPLAPTSREPFFK